MNIIVIARALNEEANIARFCDAYSWADCILIADGGSVDNTVAIARTFHNVLVRNFPERIYSPDGNVWHNPDGRHTNFLIDWGLELDPTFLVSDDMDSVPTRQLQHDARDALSAAHNSLRPAVCVRRFYLWYDGRYFPSLDVGASMWAWQPLIWRVRAQDDVNFHPAMCPLPNPDEEYAWQLPDPYRLLHRSWRDEEQIAQKITMYRAFGIKMKHPLESCGELRELPEWAK